MRHYFRNALKVNIFACITNANKSAMLIYSLIHYKENTYDCTLRTFCQQYLLSWVIFKSLQMPVTVPLVLWWPEVRKKKFAFLPGAISGQEVTKYKVLFCGYFISPNLLVGERWKENRKKDIKIALHSLSSFLLSFFLSPSLLFLVRHYQLREVNRGFYICF